MNKILPFAYKSAEPVFDLHKEALSMVLHLKRLKRAGEVLHQETGFCLADQVLTHLLVSAGTGFNLIESDLPSDRLSIRSITAERYGLESMSDASGLDAHELLAGWPQEALMQYVLDHEVPVDPRDVPGFEEIRLAG